MCDKFGAEYPSRINAAGVIEANLAGSVASSGMTDIGGFKIAFSPEQVLGFKVNGPEIINGRAAMLGFAALLIVEGGRHAALF